VNRTAIASRVSGGLRSGTVESATGASSRRDGVVTPTDGVHSI
jgi:hypothetical protein